MVGQDDQVGLAGGPSASRRSLVRKHDRRLARSVLGGVFQTCFRRSIGWEYHQRLEGRLLLRSHLSRGLMEGRGLLHPGTGVKALPPPLQLGDTGSPVGDAATPREDVPQDGGVLLHAVDPVGPVEGLERRGRDPKHLPGGFSELLEHRRGIDPGVTSDRHDRVRPHEDDLGGGRDLPSHTYGGCADAVVEDDDVGLMDRKEPGQVRG